MPGEQRLGLRREHRPPRPWGQAAQCGKQRPVLRLQGGRGCWRRSTASSWRKTRISTSLASAERKQSMTKLEAAAQRQIDERPDHTRPPPTKVGKRRRIVALRQAEAAGHRTDRLLVPHAARREHYAFCSIYPLFRRRYDPAVVGPTKGVPMKRFIGVAAGVASLLFSYPGSRRATLPTARPESASRPTSPAPASMATRTPPATGSSSDLDLARSNGEGAYAGLLPFLRFSSRQ
jgi:hypothetical protein